MTAEEKERLKHFIQFVQHVLPGILGVDAKIKSTLSLLNTSFSKPNEVQFLFSNWEFLLLFQVETEEHEDYGGDGSTTPSTAMYALDIEYPDNKAKSGVTTLSFQYTDTGGWSFSFFSDP